MSIITPNDIYTLERYGRNENRNYGEYITILGLHMQTVSLPDNITRVDVFGYTEAGESVLLRITGDPAFFYCKVPYGYDKNLFYDKLDSKSCEIGNLNLELIRKKDDRFFDFERMADFVKISSMNLRNLNQMKKECLLIWNECSAIVEDDPYKHLEYYPLRYSDGTKTTEYAYSLMTRHDVSLIGYFRVKNYEIQNSSENTIASLYITASIFDLSKVEEDIDLLDHAIVASYDLETDNLDPNKRKISNPLLDPIICIGLTFHHANSNKTLAKLCFTYKDMTPEIIDGVTLIVCENETEMILAFCKALRYKYFDILLSFNGELFDNSYLWVRAQLHGAEQDIKTLLSRYTETSQNWSSVDICSATKKGDNIMRTGLIRFRTHQWSSFDIRLHIMFAFPKIFGEKGKLSDMLLHFKVKEENGEQMGKNDLTIDKMYEYWRNKENLSEIYKYCVQDCVCSHMLTRDLKAIVDGLQLAIISHTTLNDSFYKANGIRIVKATSRCAYKMGYACMDETPPDDYKREIKVKIKGGAVESAIPGHHIFIIALDYGGQYPAQKMGSNIDTSSKVPEIMIENPELFGLTIIEEKVVIDFYGRRSIYKFRSNEGKEFIVEQFWAESDCWKKQTYYVQSPNKEIYSIKAVMLRELKTERDKFKKLLSETMDRIKSLKNMEQSDKVKKDFDIALNDATRFNSAQNGCKTQSNSEYGIQANEVFPSFDQETAATVTWCSRMLIKFLRNILETDTIIIPMCLFDKVINIINDLKFRYEIIDEPEDMLDKNGNIIYSRDLYEEMFGSKRCIKIYMPQSRLVYQDTDSNYYENLHIIFRYLGISDPIERAKLTMSDNLLHNGLIAIIIEKLINRYPISVSFEGAFLVAWYMTTKKKYIGIKCPRKIETEKDIDINIDLDSYKPGDNVMEFLDKNRIKVTGIEIVRRETASYVIKYLLSFFGKLLQFEAPKSYEELVLNIVKNFNDNFESFPVEEFSKQQKYNPSKKNDVAAIVLRLIEENKEDLIPASFQAVRYVVTKPPEFDNADMRGIIVKDVQKRMRLLLENPDIKSLDKSYYLKILVHSFSPYLLEEYYLEDYQKILQIEEKKEKTTKITQLKERVSKDVISRFYATAGRARIANNIYKNSISRIYGDTKRGKAIKQYLDGIGRKFQKYNADYVATKIDMEKTKAKRRCESAMKLINSYSDDIIEKMYEMTCDDFDRAIIEYMNVSLSIIDEAMKINDQLRICILEQRSINPELMLSDNAIEAIKNSGRIKNSDRLLKSRTDVYEIGKYMYALDFRLRKMRKQSR
jgi:DNA polymerase elongation subunit (family B)